MKKNHVGGILALISAGLSVLSLWCWGAGVGHLFRSTNGNLPMAPSTALCLCLVSIAVFLTSGAAVSSSFKKFGWFAGAVSVGVGLVAALRQSMGWHSPIEEWIAKAGKHLTDSEVDHMSPLTGVLFATIGIACLLKCQRILPTLVRSWAVALLSLAVILTSGWVIASYGAGHFLLRADPAIPTALAAAISFSLLGGALFADLKDRDAIPTRVGMKPSASAPKANFTAVWVAGALGLAICTLTSIYLRHERLQDREDARQLLQAVGNLKLEEISNWRQERLSDGRFMAEAEIVSREANRFLGAPNAAVPPQDLMNCLKLLRGDNRYSVVALLDGQGIVRLAASDATNSKVSVSPALLRETRRLNHVVMSDLSRSGVDQQVYFDVLVPISVSATLTTTPVLTRGQPIGFVLLRMDPHRFLYPLLQSWPTPSRTAETALFRKEGNDVLFLNELRHLTNSALNVRFPIIAGSTLPAVMAVLEHPGQIEGRDYRGVPVLADIRPVPGSNWYLAVKIDRDEIYSDLRQQVMGTLAFTTALTMASGLLVGYAYKRRETQEVVRELEIERQRLAMAQRVEYLMKNANDAILLADEQDNILEANNRAQELYGYTLAELRATRVSQLCSQDAAVENNRQTWIATDTGQKVFESRHKRKDGTIFPVEISGGVIELDGVRYKLGFLRDLTQRKADALEIERLTRLYATLSRVNQCIVRVKSRAELFKEVCEIAAECAGFKIAWIGWLDPESRIVKPIARAGVGGGHLDRITVSALDRLDGRGAVGTCLRNGKPCIVNDFLENPATAPWRQVASTLGLQSAAALPISFDGQICAAFTVYADAPGVFQDKEVALLDEMARNISFALDQIAREEERCQAQTSLQASNAKLEAALASMVDAVFISDLEGRFINFNEAFATFHKFKSKDDCAKTLAEYPVFLDVYHPNGELVPVAEWAVPRALRGETGKNEEYTLRRKDTGEMWVASYSFAPIRDESGAIVGAVCSGRDITDRKEELAVLEDTAAQFRGMFKQAAVGMAQVGLDGRWRLVNQRICDIVGYSREELSQKTFQEITHPDDRESGAGYMHGLLTGEIQSCSLEKRYIRKDGSFVPVKVSVALVRTASGDPGYFVTVVEDTTERNLAEAALRTSEQQFRAMFELASVGMGQADPLTGRFLRVNRKMCAITGYNSEELLQLRTVDITHPDDREVDWQAFLKVMRGEIPDYHLEKRYLRKDGSIAWVNVNVTVVRDAAGEPMRSMATIEDITERKESEVRLRQLSRAVEQSPVSIVITNHKGEMEYANPHFINLSGYIMEELRGKNPRMFKSGYTSAVEYKQLWQTIKRGETWRGEFHNRKKDGELFWESASISPLTDEKGHITHYLAVKEDITHRKINDARFRRLVDSNMQGVMFWNKEYGVTEANDAFLRIVGFSRDELKSGQLDWATMTPAEYSAMDDRAISELLNSGVCAPYEKEFTRRDGSRVPVLFGSAAFEDSPGEGVSFVIDLTERKKLEQKFLRAQRMESIGTLAGGIAHDLNNVLSPILMSVGMLKDLVRNEQDAEVLETIQGSALRGAALVKQVLSFARGLDGEKVNVNPLHLMRELVKVMKETFPKSIEVIFTPARDIWTLTGDPTQIHQVFMNLCVNARDAMPTGGKLSIRMENAVIDDIYTLMNPEATIGAYVKITVEDSGTGIPPEVRDRIFEPFFTTKEIGKGTGLGLSTSLGIVKSHRGFIDLQSEVGRGTKFIVYLPANKSELAAETIAVADVKFPSGNGELILVVDDEEGIRDVAHRTLQRFGYRTVLAKNGAEGVALYAHQSKEIAVVLTDMAMPIMDGPALIVALRSMNPLVHIIGSGGLTGKDGVADGVHLEHFLPKPYTADLLLKTLQKVLKHPL